MLTHSARANKLIKQGRGELLIITVLAATGAALLLSPWPCTKAALPAILIIIGCIIIKFLKTHGNV